MNRSHTFDGRLLWVGFIFFSLFAAIALHAVPAIAEDLSDGFAKPPDSARPWVYWFWLNGNITREGITADLEAMKRAGIGGVLIMEVDQGAPVGPVDFMSDSWRKLFKHVVAEAARLGLEVNMNDDAGWNGSGGPWIKPEESMQRVVFTETEVEGPKHFEGVLPQPQAVAGFYRDIAVQAFPSTGAYRIENIATKACYQTGYVGPGVIPNDVAPEMKIAPDALVNLSAKMDKDGRLVWDVPPGKWTIMRFGHTCTGAENAPAPKSGRGLECDKLSKEGIEANFNGMMGKLIADNGPLAGKTLVTTHIDSWENGAQNWTARMREEFKARRGYDIEPFLPVMAGRVVGSLEISERLLWDLRQTVSDLVVEYYAGHMRELANAHGLKLSIEAYGGPCDNAPYAGRADEPMAEFWMGGGGFPTPKEMASAAHTYGKPILGAEAFTAADQERWLDHPGSIKSLGDRAFCDGINRFVFHRYALQPWLDRKPGMTMGPWGLHYERTQTWWEHSRPWHEYLARCQYMLRQGRFVADICYLQPEAAPKGFMGHNRKGYDFDECSAEVVLTRMQVKDGRLVLPDGMSYRVLVLPDCTTMTPALLRKIKAFVEDGATVIGARPQKSPSLSEFPKCDADVKQLADELWADCDGKTVKERSLGKGRIVVGTTPEKLLAREGVYSDFAAQARLTFIHRATDDADIYFVANPQPHDVSTTCTFRVSGRVPEIWYPERGYAQRAPLFVEKDGLTSVALTFEPNGSQFVVFQAGAKAQDPVVAVTHEGKPLLSIAEPAQKILVTKAVYGVLEDPQCTRDVHEKVQQRVDAGEQDFQVARMSDDGDPAPQRLKTLVVEYSIGDQRFSVRANDPDTIHLTDDAAHIGIDKATYGVPGDAQRTRDVRDKLQRLVDAGESSFQVARMAEGDDPAFNVVKTLVVEYTIGAEHLTATGTDPETLFLVQHPVTTREPVVDVRCSKDGEYRVEARQNGSYELKHASGKNETVTVASLPRTQELAGPWTVEFPPNSGAPERVTLDTLSSWSDNPDPGVKYFSGTAVYKKTFNIGPEMLGDGRQLSLDLGSVCVLARILVNGQSFGTFWKAPFRINIRSAARPGENALEIQVTNLWVNRLIGDEQLPEDSERNPDGTLKAWPQWLLEDKPSPSGRFTFTSWRLWKKDAPLQPSGLLGPVTLRPFALVSVDEGVSAKARAASEALAPVNDWNALYDWFKKYGDCDDAGVAKGVSTFTVRTLAKNWTILNDLYLMASADPDFRTFVMRHIDAKAASEDLAMLHANASKACPSGLEDFCSAIDQAAIAAIGEQEHSANH